MGSDVEPCNDARMLTGACLCGELRYEAEGRAETLVHCHCSLCRKHHGAPFASVVSVPVHGLRWLSGAASVREYSSSRERARRFCGACGAVAPTSLGDRVLLPAGNLLGELDISSALHMFVGSKAHWHTIADSLPRYDTAPPGWVVGEVAARAPQPIDGRVHGSCLCGAVTFSVSGAPARWLQCHCSRCRRGRSAAHGSNTFYPASQFAWGTGRELVRGYKPPDAERFTVSFCGRCGGGAPVERENVPFVLVPAGLFDTEPGGRPQGHIHVASKAPWYPITDDLPQFAELPPS